MPSMSYCKWENTSVDFAQCMDDIEEHGFDLVHRELVHESEDGYPHELLGFRKILKLARELVSEAERAGYDWK